MYIAAAAVCVRRTAAAAMYIAAAAMYIAAPHVSRRNAAMHANENVDCVTWIALRGLRRPRNVHCVGANRALLCDPVLSYVEGGARGNAV